MRGERSANRRQSGTAEDPFVIHLLVNKMLTGNTLRPPKLAGRPS
jgi:hypothetical protein